jgi:hypothetical protein
MGCAPVLRPSTRRQRNQHREPSELKQRRGVRLLSTDNVILPPRVFDAERQQWQDPPDNQDWGKLHLRTATPDAGSEWTDDGSSQERRQLKDRAEGDTRIVPTHPELTRLLRPVR